MAARSSSTRSPSASLAVQEKVLRVIEYGTFERVGGNEALAVDVRVIAATNVDLPALARERAGSAAISSTGSPSTS